MELSFDIPGPPVGKERPRMNTKTRVVYTPKNTRRYEKFVGTLAWAAAQIQKKQAWPVRKGQLFADLRIHFGTQASQAPDPDNVVKAVLDGMEGVLYKNDRQVLPRVQHVAYESSKPRVEVRIETI